MRSVFIGRVRVCAVFVGSMTVGASRLGPFTGTIVANASSIIGSSHIIYTIKYKLSLLVLSSYNLVIHLSVIYLDP
jgi:hypothetical protein